METNKKPTFYELRLEHSVNMYQLSQESGISSLVVWSLLTGRPVTKHEAQHVLDALNRLRHTQYTLSDVALVLEDVKDNEI
ncbi:MAG TPA: hypothetical protein DHW02_21530 [Ktedonobacter sp.]|nr:hypothetical protein [Ktedonobacter sp.]